jgi:ABC-type dipeptide/oligopeptide/nickel transport system permease subunit
MALLTLVIAGALFAPQIGPFDYSRQFRESPHAPAGGQFLMGTDDLGRDRFSRLIYATRVSILLAPAAAIVSVLLALLFWRFTALTTLSLSLPWIFLFIILRALLPLNTRPAESILLTFGLMGVAGWAWPARVFAGSIRQIRQSGWLMQARAAGVTDWRIFFVYTWPHLRAIAFAQVLVLIPAYILSEASLGLLGLGVAEPLPSLGNLLAELQRPEAVRSNPWVLAPLGVLMLVMICLEALQPARESRA